MKKTQKIELYTIQEVANVLRVSRQTIYNYVRKKRLKATKIGREYRISEEDIRDFLKSGQTM